MGCRPTSFSPSPGGGLLRVGQAGGRSFRRLAGLPAPYWGGGGSIRGGVGQGEVLEAIRVGQAHQGRGDGGRAAGG